MSGSTLMGQFTGASLDTPIYRGGEMKAAWIFLQWLFTPIALEDWESEQW